MASEAKRKLSRKPTKAPTPKKLGFKIDLQSPVSKRSRKLQIKILHKNGKVAWNDRADLAAGEQRNRLARKLAKRLSGEVDKWERGLERAHLAFVEQQAVDQANNNVPAGPVSPDPPDSRYLIQSGQLCMHKDTRDGPVVVALCNFVARVIEALGIDDGSGDIEHVFTVEGTLANGKSLPLATVRATDFPVMHWPLKHWGLEAVVSPGVGTRDHLRAAIQLMSGGAVQRTIYKHTGWRYVNGESLFLHAGGAIGAGGTVKDVSVDLDGQLGDFFFASIPQGQDCIQAVRASLDLLRISPRLMVPLLGSVYRSVLGPADCSVHLAGHTGHGKSELAALAQQHFGARMDRLHLPASWLSTGNSLEAMAFLAKDVVLVIDDFKPGGSKSEIERLHAQADRVLRSQGNRSGRGRCRADGTLRPARSPRGFIISTGEDIPRGESLRARLLALDVNRNDVDLQSLTPYQQQAAQGVYSLALAAYLRWLAGRYDAVMTSLQQERDELRSKARLEKSHARTPGIVADLALGWKHFLQFALEIGAVTQDECNQLKRTAWNTLLATGADQEAEIAGQDHASRFLKLLSSVLSSGRGHVADRSGGSPPNAEAWGWHPNFKAGTFDSEPSVTYAPQGRNVGWIVENDLYLDAEAAFAEIQALGELQGERLPITQGQLNKRLKERGLLASTERGKHTIRRQLQGASRAVLHLRASHVVLQKPGESGESGDSLPEPSPENPDSPDSGESYEVEHATYTTAILPETLQCVP